MKHHCESRSVEAIPDMRGYQVILSIIILFIFVLSFPQAIFAANYSLSIYPPLLRVHIKPGKSITQVFKIENQSTTDKTLIANIVPFSEADNMGNPILDPKSNASWIDYFSLVNSQIKLNEPFTIVAGASQQLVLSLSIPETAPLKDIYATLIVSTYSNTLDQTYQGTTLRATIGSNLLVTISNQAFPDTVLRIEDFNPTEGTFMKIGNLYFVDSITPVKFTATVKNEGNFTADTRGVFRISTGKDKPVYLEGVLSVNVIGKSKRLLLNTSGSAFEFTPSMSHIGQYRVSMEIKTENSNTISTINVFFFPLKISLALIITLLVLITIIKTASKPSNKSVDNNI